MGRYAQWDGYRQVYPDGLSQEEFEGVLSRAEALMDIWTAGRAKDAQGENAQKVEMAVYALANALAKEERAGGGGVEIESVSNDGYSERYFKKESADAVLKAEVFRWLSGTGLVSAL